MTSSYDDPKPQHRDAVKQIAEARELALTAVSEVRQRSLPGPDEHLTPAQEDPTFQGRANQAVTNYLLNLRPYRNASDKWNIDFGEVELPKEIPGGSKPGRSRGERPNYRICRRPSVSLPTVSRLIAAVNTDIVYSTARPPSPDNNEPKIPDGWVGWRVRGQRLIVPADKMEAHLRGEITHDELKNHAKPLREPEEQSDEFRPSTPLRGDTKHYQFVFGADELLQIVELADEVAGEMDFLAEIEDKTARDNTGL
jgi:hypothetical protein